MPLKTDDLKTVDSYKKALKVDGAKISAGSKVKFWLYRDVELPTASGQKQKLPALITLFDDNAVKPLLKGKPPVCRGLCGMEGGKIAFEPAQGKLPYAVLVKSVPLLLGKMLHIPSGADSESDEEEIPPAPPAPPAVAGSAPSPGRYAQLNAAWKQLAQQAEARIKSYPGEQTRLAPVIADIPKMLQSGQLADAEKRIEQLQMALKAPPPPPPGGPQGPNYAQLNNGWKQLSQLASQKIAANPAQRDVLTKAMAGIPEMLQGGQLVEAGKRLELLQAAIRAAPPAPQPPPAGAQGSRPASGADSGRTAGTPHPGLVKYRTALVQFAQAKSKVQGQIRGLQAALIKRWPAEARFAKDMAEEIEELNQELQDAVDEAMKASGNQASPATDAVKLKIRKCLTELAGNPLIAEADSNPLGVPVTIRQTLGEALGRIRDAMPA